MPTVDQNDRNAFLLFKIRKRRVYVIILEVTPSAKAWNIMYKVSNSIYAYT